MSGTAPWLRLDAAVFQEPRVSSVCPPFGALTWIAVLSMSKLHGWDGLCPAELVTGGAIARHVGAEKGLASRFGAALAGLEASGLLEREEGGLRIVDWRRFQPDPTGTERSRRWREAHRSATVATVATVGNDDVTGRDGTGRDELPPPLPPPLPGPGSAEDTAPGGEPPPTFLGASHLSPALANVLSLSGVGNLRKRPGKFWEWEKALEALSEAGTPDAVLVRALKDPKYLTLMPHQFLESFQPKDRRGRVELPSAPSLSPEEARRQAREFLGKGRAS